MALISQEHLSETAANHDRIQLDFMTIHLSGYSTYIYDFLTLLSQSTWTRSHSPEDENNPERIFCNIQNHRASYQIAVRDRLSRNQPNIGAPLFGGRLHFRTRNRFDLDIHNQEMFGTIELTLNPIRAYMHQPRGRLSQTSQEISLQARALSEPTNEHPIKPHDDNVVINGRGPRRRIPTPSLIDFTNRYIASVLSFLRTLVDQAKSQVLAHVPRDRNNQFILQMGDSINVRQVETCWDLPTEDPIGNICRCEPGFRALGTESSRRIYRNVHADFDTIGNVPVVSVRTGAGRKAKLYAKTTRKARLEILHNLQTSNGTMAHTFSGDHAIPEMLQLLGSCRRQARNDALSLAASFQQDEGDTVRQESPYTLINEIYRATSDQTGRELLLSALINNGSYTHRTNDPLRQTRVRLQNRGVLVPTRGRSRVYRLAPAYQEARTVLANHVPLAPRPVSGAAQNEDV